MTMTEALSEVPLQSELEPSLARTTIQGLDYDSRRIQPGWIFFAFPGARFDGREFAAAGGRERAQLR